MVKRLEPLGLLLTPTESCLLSSSQLLQQRPLLAVRQGKRWVFGQAATLLATEPVTPAEAQFPWAAFLQDFLEPVAGLRKKQLVLILATPQLWPGLWEPLLERLGVAQWQLLAFAEVLLPTRSGILVYLEHGLAQVVVRRQRELLAQEQIGYGYYLTRELRKQVFERHGILLELKLAERIWQKLWRPGQQVTIQGKSLEGENRSQLLISEDLKTIFQQALQPLKQELCFLGDCYQLPIVLAGPESALPGLAVGLQGLQGLPVDVIAQDRDMLYAGVQHLLKEMKA